METLKKIGQDYQRNIAQYGLDEVNVRTAYGESRLIQNKRLRSRLTYHFRTFHGVDECCEVNTRHNRGCNHSRRPDEEYVFKSRIWRHSSPC